jgi:hypothetical protein
MIVIAWLHPICTFSSHIVLTSRLLALAPYTADSRPFVRRSERTEPRLGLRTEELVDPSRPPRDPLEGLGGGEGGDEDEEEEEMGEDDEKVEVGRPRCRRGARKGVGADDAKSVAGGCWRVVKGYLEHVMNVLGWGGI